MTGFLKAMPGYVSGRLTLHGADLDHPGCFDEIFKGCHGVAHVSHVSTYDDQDYVKSVCDHLIASVEKSGSVHPRGRHVQRRRGDVRGRHRRNSCAGRSATRTAIRTSRNPKRTPDRGQGYSMGKVIAERAFAEAAEHSGGRLGRDHRAARPTTSGRSSRRTRRTWGPWQHLIELMLLGECCEIFQGTGAVPAVDAVDVRDDAACHVGLLESDRVRNGERYIAWSTDTPQGRGHLRGHRPGAARARPRHATGHRQFSRARARPRGRVPRDLGRLRPAQRSHPAGDRRQFRPSTSRCATASNRCSASPGSDRSCGRGSRIGPETGAVRAARAARVHCESRRGPCGRTDRQAFIA